jgi:hypothetical protein
VELRRHNGLSTMNGRELLSEQGSTSTSLIETYGLCSVFVNVVFFAASVGSPFDAGSTRIYHLYGTVFGLFS